MALYDANNQIILTEVDGSSYTGLYAADGSYNIVINNRSTYKGLYHPCGAYNAVVYSSGIKSYYAPNGSVYITDNADETGYTILAAAG